MNNPITTHILDTSQGKPAENVNITLFVLQGKEWVKLSSAITNQDGRINDWQDNSWYQDTTITDLFGTYKLVFDLDPYWETQSTPAFYPSAEISFRLQDERHHHIPLLLNAFGYSTYRGS